MRGLSRIKACVPTLPQHSPTMRVLPGLLVFLWTQSFAAAGDAEFVRAMVRLVRQDCGACHGMTLQGGLGSPLTRAALAGRPAEALAATILHGRPGTAMPAWRTLLSEAQAQWIAERLLEGFPAEAPQ